MMRALGWIPDLPDHRDFKYSMKPPVNLPKSLEMKLDFVYDQGALGSCTAQAAATVYRYTEIEQDGSAPSPSRLALYYFTRKDQGTVNYDSGASIRGSIKAIAKWGVCHEELWPYKVDMYKKAPSREAQSQAMNHRLESRAYARVNQNLGDLKSCLVANNPITFGFTVYESFMSQRTARSGICPMPERGEKATGGHAVVLIGYDDEKRCFLVKNSWGRRWGLNGNFWMPYDYVVDDNLASDFWTLYKVSPLSA